MEELNPQFDELELERRVRQWRRFLSGVVSVEDLFPEDDGPPESGVREPRRPRPSEPRLGAIALELCAVAPV